MPAPTRAKGRDYGAALPEFDARADAYARIAGPTGEQARACRAQEARCRAELGQVTDALAELQDVLNVVRTVDSDMSEEAVELQHDIGMLLLAQGRAVEARQVLEPLPQDMCMVFGPDADAPWLATPYVPGPTLAQHLAAHGPLAGATLYAFATGTAQALAAIRGRGGAP